MSRTSKSILKMIFVVLMIYFVVAAIPIFQTVVQSFLPTQDLLSTPVVLLQVSQATGKPMDLNVLAAATQSPAMVSPAFTATLVLPSQTATLPEPSSTTAMVEATAQPTASAVVTALPSSTQPSQANSLPGPVGPYKYLLLFIQNSFTPTYQLQKGTPLFTQNFAHAYAGCDLMEVAGQVFDSKGNALTNLVEEVKGELNGSKVDLLGMTGLADAYGPGGYEIQLANAPVDTNGDLSIQVLDLAGHPLSDLIPFNTSADCSKNVVLINFTPVSATP